MGCFGFGPNAPIVPVGLAGKSPSGLLPRTLNQSGL
jgi:hypothetical protein